jgi:hypothetical protein
MKLNFLYYYYNWIYFQSFLVCFKIHCVFPGYYLNDCFINKYYYKKETKRKNNPHINIFSQFINALLPTGMHVKKYSMHEYGP